jgi:hypothetical protein
VIALNVALAIVAIAIVDVLINANTASHIVAAEPLLLMENI